MFRLYLLNLVLVVVSEFLEVFERDNWFAYYGLFLLSVRLKPSRDNMYLAPNLVSLRLMFYNHALYHTIKHLIVPNHLYKIKLFLSKLQFKFLPNIIQCLYFVWSFLHIKNLDFYSLHHSKHPHNRQTFVSHLEYQLT